MVKCLDNSCSDWQLSSTFDAKFTIPKKAMPGEKNFRRSVWFLGQQNQETEN